MIVQGLTAALVAAVVVAGCQTVRLSSAHEDMADLRAEHADLVADAERARATASEKYRELERQRDAELDVLRTAIGDREHARKAADTAARQSGDELRSLTAAIAEQANRAAENPGTAPRVDAACATTAELLGEAAATAGELAQEAGRLASMTMGLQHYVRTVCLTPR